MINERMLELLVLLGITEKIPYNKEKKLFYYQDKRYDVDKVTNRIYELVTEFMKEYEDQLQVNDVTEIAEKSE